MTHYALLALTTSDTRDELDALMAPYNESVRVAPWRRRGVLGWLAEREGLDSDEAVLAWVNEHWTEEADSYGIDADGLYQETTYNPNSRWDAWTIGGPAAVHLVGTNGVQGYQYLAAQIDWDATFNLARPFAFVSAEGWRAPGNVGWFGTDDTTAESNTAFDRWLDEFTAALPASAVVTSIAAHI